MGCCLSDLNDNHYRIGLSTIIFIIYKISIIAYNSLKIQVSIFMSKPSIHVAIALLLYRGKVLVGWRNADQHQGNKYEFPGGKIEAGETPVEACRREIFEEVGIGIQQWHAFDVIHHVYDDVEVFLHLFHATVPEQYLHAYCRYRLQSRVRYLERSEPCTAGFVKAKFHHGRGFSPARAR